MSYRIRWSLTGIKVLAFLCLLVFACMVIPGPSVAYAGDTGLPDLFIKTISPYPAMPAIGQNVSVSATVINRGEADSNPCLLIFYIGDSVIHSTTIDTIPAGQSRTCTFTRKAKPGAHVVVGIIDGENDVAESNESNNSMTFAFSVLAADLSISGITWEPETVSAGETVVFSIVVKNRGDLASRYGELNFSINKASRGNVDIPALQPGESVNRTFQWIAQPGSYLLQAEADCSNTTVESNESNNEFSTEFSTNNPDLIIESITWTPEARNDTDNITTTVSVKNQGVGSSGHAWLTYYIDDLPMGRNLVEPLSVNETASLSYNWYPGSGNRTFGAYIDHDVEILELDDDNNFMSVDIPAVAGPDLVISDISWLPSPPLIAYPVTFTITVKNTGSETVLNTFLYFRSNYGHNSSRSIASLAPGETSVQTFTIKAMDRELCVTAIVDDENQIAEMDETNNSKSVSVQPTNPEPTSDLQILGMSISPAAPAAGETVTVSATVKNNGPSASPESHLVFHLDDTLLGTVAVKNLPANGSIRVSYTCQAAPGTHTFTAGADFNNYIAETDEENNNYDISFTTKSSDLVIKSLQWAPECPEIGDTVTIVAVIENRGDAVSEESSVSYYINDEPRGEHHVNPIEPGSSVIRTFTWQAQVIPDSFGAVIDADNTTPESNEANNTKLAPLPAPDLSIEDIFPVPESIEEGMSVNFTVVISNNGGGEMEDTSITAFLDGEPLASINSTNIAAGESNEYTFPWIAELGNHRFEVFADESDLIVESNEANNAASFIFSVLERVTSISDNATSGSETGSSGIGGGAPSLIVPEEDTSIDPELIDYLQEELSYQEEEMPETSESFAWWDIFTNLWFIIGVAVFGVVSIGILLFLRRRAAGRGDDDTESQPEPTPES